MTTQRDDHGFSLIELLLVIVILGILAIVVSYSVGGMTAEAEEVGCEADAKTLYMSIEAFFAQRSTDTIPATGPSPDRYELTLVDEEFMRNVSSMYDVDEFGQLAPATSSVCVA